jgi:hypothetical protein
MNKIKSDLKSYIKSFQPVQKHLHKKYINEKYITELQLIRGTHKNNNDHPSIIHFSLNKAATQYVKSILFRCAVENGMVPVRIHDFAFNTDFPYLDFLSEKEMDEYKHIFKNTGYVYSSFGGMIEGIPDLEAYKVVFMTRDPRDILVSNFFSVGYSHKIPDKYGNKHASFVLMREHAKNLTIDEYVLAECNRLLDIFTRYQSLLIEKYKDIHITTYEKMTESFDRWLIDLLDYCKLNISKNLMESIILENQRKKPKSENILKHVRKGQAGDYLNKLKQETIDALNDKFALTLAKFNYTI